MSFTESFGMYHYILWPVAVIGGLAIACFAWWVRRRPRSIKAILMGGVVALLLTVAALYVLPIALVAWSCSHGKCP